MRYVARETYDQTAYAAVCEGEAVCGGIAEYFNIDSTLVRLGWVLFSLLGGSGLLAYIIAAIIMPDRPY